MSLKNIRRKTAPDANKMESEPSPPARAIAAAEKKLSSVVKSEPAVRRTVRAAARIADRLTEGDREKALETIRGAMEAENVIYDGSARKLVRTPEYKTRLAAATLLLAYDEGLPVKRQITLTGDFKGAEDVMDRFRNSPEGAKTLAGLVGLGLKLEVGGEAIDIETETVDPET